MHAERQLPLYFKLTEYAVTTHYVPGSHPIHTLMSQNNNEWKARYAIRHEGRKKSKDMWKNLNQRGKILGEDSLSVELSSVTFEKFYFSLDLFLKS